MMATAVLEAPSETVNFALVQEAEPNEEPTAFERFCAEARAADPGITRGRLHSLFASQARRDNPRALLPTYSVEFCRKDSIAASVGVDAEPAPVVERLLKEAEVSQSPVLAFQKALFSLEPSSCFRDFRRAQFQADVFLACKKALFENHRMLWEICYALFFGPRRYDIPGSVLSRSPLVAEIAFRCGKQIIKRRLVNYTRYCQEKFHRPKQRGFHV